MKKIIIDVAIDLLLSIIAVVSFLVSFWFCNGTFIGTMLTLLMLTITTVCTFIVGYRINK